MLPQEIQEKLSHTEEDYFKKHAGTLQSYMSRLDLDLTVVTSLSLSLSHTQIGKLKFILWDYQYYRVGSIHILIFLFLFLFLRIIYILHLKSNTYIFSLTGYGVTQRSLHPGEGP